MLLDAAKAVYTLPPDKLEKAIHIYHARTLAHFGDTAWMMLALWLLVRWGVGARIRDWAESWSSRSVGAGICGCSSVAVDAVAAGIAGRVSDAPGVSGVRDLG